jgi:hypothetical protein
MAGLFTKGLVSRNSVPRVLTEKSACDANRCAAADESIAFFGSFVCHPGSPPSPSPSQAAPPPASSCLLLLLLSPLFPLCVTLSLHSSPMQHCQVLARPAAAAAAWPSQLQHASSSPARALLYRPRRRAAARAALCSQAAEQQQQQQCRCGIVVVDHGSRRQASNNMLVEFCQLYQQLTQQPIVQPAHMEIAEPTIAQAIGEQYPLQPVCGTSTRHFLFFCGRCFGSCMPVLTRAAADAVVSSMQSQSCGAEGLA